MKLVKIVPSTRQDKRMMAIFTSEAGREGEKERTTHFGIRGGSTYIDNKSQQKRAAYIARHRVNENFNDPDSAGALARWILWGPSTSLRENIKAFKRKFNL